jgi:hypothetical protein
MADLFWECPLAATQDFSLAVDFKNVIYPLQKDFPSSNTKISCSLWICQSCSTSSRACVFIDFVVALTTEYGAVTIFLPMIIA